MADKYKSKYRAKSARMPEYDYRKAGLYFIIICTADRQHYFCGDHRKQQLADVFWHEQKSHTTNYRSAPFCGDAKSYSRNNRIIDGKNIVARASDGDDKENARDNYGAFGAGAQKKWHIFPRNPDSYLALSDPTNQPQPYMPTDCNLNSPRYPDFTTTLSAIKMNAGALRISSKKTFKLAR